jgi:hypothetical protein
MEHKYDSVVTSVISAFQKRAEIGKQKYGTDLDRKDLSVLEWIQHAYGCYSVFRKVEAGV